ncbi:MAG: gamma-glutamyl-gamma-aminobutyrate hydrolase family protein [Clostridia bacterium]|nr:gamma-glutamyl-gamma-aminobutyrate hydrolase family protein [Clostridia bacterium]
MPSVSLEYPVPQTPSDPSSKEIPVIGVAWRTRTDTDSFRNFLLALEQAGARYVLLNQVVSADFRYDENLRLLEGRDSTGALSREAGELVKTHTWHGSNAVSVLHGLKAVLFTGGEDISPSLYRIPQEWHGIPEDCNYHAERDISDYLLMSYCLDLDIPFLAVCRSMQMLGIVSGAELIQDIPSYLASHHLQDQGAHRQILTDPSQTRDYVPDDVHVEKDTILFQITGQEDLYGCPCWHHQAVRSTEGTNLRISAYSDAGGFRIIEGIERTDKHFAVGLQFHPETSVGKTLRQAPNRDLYLPMDLALSFFRRLAHESR